MSAVDRAPSALAIAISLSESEALETMNLERLQEIEMIDPTPQPPWRKEAFSSFRVRHDVRG
jgi:hypothetical protein